MRKLRVILSVITFGLVGSAFATPSGFDTVIGDVSTEVLGYVTTALPLIGGVIVAGLGIWGIIRISKMFRRAL